MGVTVLIRGFLGGVTTMRPTVINLSNQRTQQTDGTNFWVRDLTLIFILERVLPTAIESYLQMVLAVSVTVPMK